jgi:hypothetical protein
VDTLDGYLRNGIVVDANGEPVGHTIKVRASEGYGPMARTYVSVRWAGHLFTGVVANGSDHVQLKPVKAGGFASPLLREYVEKVTR